MPDSFNKEKSDFLRKKDKSRKGHIDKDIKSIIENINPKNDYYTTSSCSGRIVLLEMKSRKKNECHWIFIKHDKANFNEIKHVLNQYNKKISKKRGLPLKVSRKEKTSFETTQFKHQIWFKQQPIILHVACRNLGVANKLLNLSRKIFKRAGIISLSNRKIVIEIIGSERLETIIADKNFVADNNYIKNLVKFANRNFEENKRKSEKFFKVIRDNL